MTPYNFQTACLDCVGVSCTSSLVGKLSILDYYETNSSDADRRREQRKSRAYIACSTLKDGTYVWEVELDNNSDIAVVNESQKRRTRTRLEEEAVISNLILLMMLQYREGKVLNNNVDKDDDELNGLLKQILDRDGDEITIQRISHQLSPTAATNADKDEGRASSAANGASQIINGEANVVAVLPTYSYNGDGPKQQRMEVLLSNNNIPFPNDVLIVPGSFNPPHSGHVGLANAAVSALRRLRRKEEEAEESNTISSRAYWSRYSSLSSTVSVSSTASSSSAVLKRMWSTVDEYTSEQSSDPTVFFEMSVTNADKPPLDPIEVERRVNMFVSSPSLKEADMPKDWAVLLTNAPLFSQKSDILDNLIPGDSGRRKMSFVLGTDTMVRIINPKYYENSREKMIDALVNMKDKGVHFIVGGRLEQGTDSRYVYTFMWCIKTSSVLIIYCYTHCHISFVRA